FTESDARRFAEALTRNLSLDPEFVQPAYEDPLHFLDQEGRLPLNVEPGDNRLADAEERERLRRVFERGLDKPVGFVLPLVRRPSRSGPEWQSGMWMLRSQHLRLLPGDSPVGLRLPLDSLPFVEEDDLEVLYPQDPFA